MKITYATNHTWYKFLAEDPLTQFGKNSAAKIRATHRKLSGAGVTIEAIPVDDSLLEWFVPLYEKHIEKKDHPFGVDIRKRIGDPTNTLQYFALVLYQDALPVGATLFTERKNKLSLAYRTYTQRWPGTDLPASPSLLMEYEIALHALRRGKKAITHGKDRNPYGLNSDIGLAAFKLGSGCKIRKSKKFTLAQLDTQSLESDVFVLEYPGEDRRRITKGYLITDKENLPRYQQLIKYPHLLEVEVLLRNR